MAIVSDQIDISARRMPTDLPTHVIDSHIPMMLKLASIPSMACTSPLYVDAPRRLFEPEIDGEVVVDGDRVSVQRARFEFPEADGPEGFLVQPHWKRLEDTRFGHVALAVDDRFDDDDSLHARLPRHFGVHRLDARDDHRRLDVAADAHRHIARAANLSAELTAQRSADDATHDSADYAAHDSTFH